MRLSFLCRRSGVTQFNKVYKLLVIFLHLVSFEMNDEFQGRRALRGKSDPTSLHCQCNNNGLVLLFYKYILVTNVKSLAQQLKINSLSLTGKIRIGVEGFNVTVAGSISHINTFIAFMRSTEYLNENQTKEQDVTFFKPSPGCIHAFESMSIKIVDEICPFNLNPNTPTITVDDVHILSPSQFHEALLKRSEDDTTLLLDTRNYYESKIGHFQHAILPPIRKFSALPAYLDTNRHIFKPNHHLLTYCTGGIRCAKSNTFISAQLNIKVSMLDGGIHNYLEWIKQTGNKSLFLGRNYVFDARVSLGLEDNSIVSECVYCQVLEDKGYVKCFGLECHLFVVCCERCNDDNEGKVFCCLSCKSGNLKKGFCGCEVERRIKCATPIHCQAS